MAKVEQFTPQQLQQMITGFNRNTRRNIRNLVTVAYTANAPVQVPIPQTGLLAAIFGQVDIVITTGATGVYANSNTITKTGGITPFSAINGLRVTNNQANALYSTSWYGNYLINRMYKENYDWINPPTGLNVEAGSYWLKPTVSAVSTQYTFRAPFYIPVALGPQLQSGLQMLATNDTRYNLEILWGDIANNLISATGTTPSVTVNSATATVGYEYFNVPNKLPIEGLENANFPDLSRSHVIVEDTRDITGTGDYIYPVQTGPEYLSIMQEYVNNGAGMSSAVMTNQRDVFSGNQELVNMTAAQFLFLQSMQLGGAKLPQGVYLSNYKAGGSATIDEASVRDIIRTDQLTEFQKVGNIAAGTALTSAFVRTIREYNVLSSFAG